MPKRAGDVTNMLSRFLSRWSILISFLKICEVCPRTTRMNRPAKLRPTVWRLDPPSSATAPRVVAIPVRSFGRLRVRPVAHTQALLDDTAQTIQTRGCSEMLAFCHFLQGRERNTLSHR